MKILVCDDIRDRGKETLQEIERGIKHGAVLLSKGNPELDLSNGDLTAGVLKGDLAKEIDRLFIRARSILGSPKSSEMDTNNTPSVFERHDLDIVILDNNLSKLDIGGTMLTAESLAGYVRAFGRIPYVISLNKNPQVDFDLRYLVGDYQTQADLALNNAHLANHALWNGRPKVNEFLPWYWPVLNHAPERRREQIKFVAKYLDKQILKTLKFPVSAPEHLSPHALGALCPEEKDVRLVTFREFFITSCRSLPNLLDREELANSITSTAGLGRDVICRVVAGELDKWIRRDLLGSQDVLVDLPHLLMRMPFLLGKNAHNVQRWNRAVMESSPPYGLSPDLYEKHVERSRFRHDFWAKSPCFWWQKLKSDRKLGRIFQHDESKWASAVFCEDLSRFKSSEAKTNPPIEFFAEFEGSWPWRHVTLVDGKNYVPWSRLAM